MQVGGGGGSRVWGAPRHCLTLALPGAADAKNLLAQAAISSNGLKQVIANRAATVRADHVFSHKIPVEGKATSQKSSGRCWLFAATNVIRLRMMAKYNLPADFEFSQSYLFFYDKLEKSNYFLENMIDLADAHVDDRTVQRLLSDPVSDGGQWSMFQSLVNSHGLVPKSVFPECSTSSASREFNAFLKNQLRGFACKLRERKAAGETVEQLRVAKNTMMATVHRMLLIHFGEPPKTFEWAYCTSSVLCVWLHAANDRARVLLPVFVWQLACRRQGQQVPSVRGHDMPGAVPAPVHQPWFDACLVVGYRVTDLTPQTFYRDMVPFDANEFVSLINDPRNEYQKLYTVDRLGNIVGGTPVAYINVPIDTIRKYGRSEGSMATPVCTRN